MKHCTEEELGEVTNPIFAAGEKLAVLLPGIDPFNLFLSNLSSIEDRRSNLEATTPASHEKIEGRQRQDSRMPVSSLSPLTHHNGFCFCFFFSRMSVWLA